MKILFHLIKATDKLIDGEFIQHNDNAHNARISIMLMRNRKQLAERKADDGFRSLQWCGFEIRRDDLIRRRRMNGTCFLPLTRSENRNTQIELYLLHESNGINIVHHRHRQTDKLSISLCYVRLIRII